jgi:hypothetical protein
MCEFITAILPAEADFNSLTSIVKRHHLVFTPIQNDTVIAQLAPGETYYRTNRSMCDCGTGLGCLATVNRKQNQSDHALARKVRKFQASGWSQTKIDRWLAQHDETRLNRVRSARDHYISDAERWLNIISEILDSDKTPSFKLLIHWFPGELESERIQIQRRCKISINDARPDVMLHMEHDVLYEFTK